MIRKKVVRALQGKIVDILCSFGLLAVFFISPNSIQSETLSFCCLKSGPRVALLLDLISLEAEALNGSLIMEVVPRRVGCSPVQLTLVLPLRQEWIRSGDSAHCSEPRSRTPELIYLLSAEIWCIGHVMDTVCEAVKAVGRKMCPVDRAVLFMCT